jgi:hypothetical protein
VIQHCSRSRLRELLPEHILAKKINKNRCGYKFFRFRKQCQLKPSQLTNKITIVEDMIVFFEGKNTRETKIFINI